MMLISENDAIRIGKAVAESLYKLSPKVGEMFGPNSWQMVHTLWGGGGIPGQIRYYWNGSELRVEFIGPNGSLFDELYFRVRDAD